MSTILRAEPAGGRQATFGVALIFLVEGPALRERIAAGDDAYAAPAPVLGHGEVFLFNPELAADARALEVRLAALRSRDRPVQFVVVSDRLADRDPSGKLVPSGLARRIRAMFADGPHLGGLVALAGPPASRVSDVDATLPADADRAAVRAAIERVATGLRLKAPPPIRPEPPPGSIRVEVAQSPETLRACLALRRRVYGLLGYLPDPIAADPSGLEMDGYDAGSVHLAAVRGREVVGTARLVVELPEDPCSVSGLDFRAIDTYCRHRDWARALARRAGGAVRRRALNRPFMPLPILQSSEFHDRWASMLERTSAGSELSRVVVAPDCRGLGISKLLVLGSIAKAFQMSRGVVLLECIPLHVSMYARYGFRRLGGETHTRPADLDQQAVGMWYRFDEGRVAAAAERLLAKIQMEMTPSFGPIDVTGAPPAP